MFSHIGIQQVMDIDYLHLFSCEEMCQLFEGTHIHWTKEFLLENVTYTQGYTKSDPYINQFAEIVSEFSDEDKERLLMFITGERRIKVCTVALQTNVRMIC